MSLEKRYGRAVFFPEMDGFLATGGFRYESFNCVELMSRKTWTWRRLAPMLTERHEHGCVAYQGKVYVTGGYCDAHHDANTWTCEVFTPPKSHDPTDLGQWTYIAELKPGERSAAYAITHANRLLFIGKFCYAYIS